ncbi:hypothetical protein MWU50_15130 [Flavobacteriaceae bacterium S0862]|nr:hypothetical protein [Flavobacteriaceae bacterium S0862]
MMKINYLLPNKFKLIGWILLIIGLICGAFLFFGDFGNSAIQLTEDVVINDRDLIDGKSAFYNIVGNSLVDEIIVLLIIFGGLIVGFSKEKIEDEFIFKLRNDSLVWAIIFNYLVLIITVLFVYGLSFFHVLVFNMFTPLLFFIVRFNFLKFKSTSNEE